MPSAAESSRAKPCYPMFVAAAITLACLLVIVDMVLGALLIGAHLGAPVTGLPLPVVDLLGLVAYLAFVVCTSLVARLACIIHERS